MPAEGVLGSFADPAGRGGRPRAPRTPAGPPRRPPVRLPPRGGLRRRPDRRVRARRRARGRRAPAPERRGGGGAPCPGLTSPSSPASPPPPPSAAATTGAPIRADEGLSFRVYPSRATVRLIVERLTRRPTSQRYCSASSAIVMSGAASKSRRTTDSCSSEMRAGCPPPCGSGSTTPVLRNRATKRSTVDHTRSIRATGRRCQSARRRNRARTRFSPTPKRTVAFASPPAPSQPRTTPSPSEACSTRSPRAKGAPAAPGR